MEHLEYFTFCLKVMLEEVKKFNLYEPDLIACISQMSTFDLMFERPYERCAYMYKYATCHLNFMKDCFRIFFKDYPKIKELLLTWKTCKNINLCSLSHGPGLDYLAFIIALAENVEVELQTSFKEVKIISKSTQWKNTYNFMVEAIQMGYLKNVPVSMIHDKIKIIQNNNQKFNEKQRNALQDVDILCMMKALNLSGSISPELKQYYKEIISSMKTDSLLFCVDTKPSVEALAEILYEIPGEYIYEPVYNRLRFPEKFPDDYKVKFGGMPGIGATGWFFVWKKFSLNSSHNKIYPSILIGKSIELGVKTLISSNNGIKELTTSNSLNTEASSISAQYCSKIECNNTLENNATICDITDYKGFKENLPMCSEKSKETSNQIEKSFNESLKISDDCNLTDSMSNLSITKRKSSQKINNESTTNLIHIPPAKKSVKVGSNLKLENEGNSSIQDLTDRIKKLTSSFENMISQNIQSKVSKENVVEESLQHHSCCRSTLFCRYRPNYYQQHSLMPSKIAGVSSSDSLELPSSSSQGTKCNAHNDGTDTKTHVHEMNIETQNFKCPRQHFCCNGRTQNCPSQISEHNLCCMSLSCNHEVTLNRCCGHGSQNGINLTVPNIIIPLQNISDDILAQLLTLLKTVSSSKH